jgi:hypothetical protein
MNRAPSVIAATLLAIALQAGGAAAAGENAPIGTVTAKNLVERTVTIDDQTYRVDGSTRILGKEGQPMTLEQVQTAAGHGALVRLDDVTYAYDARGGSLEEMRAVDVPR